MPISFTLSNNVGECREMILYPIEADNVIKVVDNKLANELLEVLLTS